MKVARMMNCCVCQHDSGRMEICFECALILWPHEVINQGAKDLKHKVMSVPRAPGCVPSPDGQPQLVR